MPTFSWNPTNDHYQIPSPQPPASVFLHFLWASLSLVCYSLCCTESFSHVKGNFSVVYSFFPVCIFSSNTCDLIPSMDAESCMAVFLMLWFRKCTWRRQPRESWLWNGWRYNSVCSFLCQVVPHVPLPIPLPPWDKRLEKFQEKQCSFEVY